MDLAPLLLIAGGLVVVWLALIAVLWFVAPRRVGVRDVVRVVPDILLLVRDLLTDRAVPAAARIALGGLLVWLLSPIDLVPEFIPVIGPLDDVIVAILVLRFVRRRVGDDALRQRWRGTPAGYELLLALLR